MFSLQSSLIVAMAKESVKFCNILTLWADTLGLRGQRLGLLEWDAETTWVSLRVFPTGKN